MATVELRALFAGSISDRLAITVSSDSVRVISIDDVGLPTTLSATAGSVLSAPAARVSFDDGSVFPRGTFSPAVISNLVTFSSSDDEVLSIDSETGVLTLLKNSVSVVDVQVTAVGNPLVVATASTACNLQPGRGDMDLGSSAGSALGVVQLGDEISVPVRVNIGPSGLLRSVRLAVQFPEDRLTPLRVDAGADLPSSGTWLFSTFSDPVTTVSMGAITTTDSSIHCTELDTGGQCTVELFVLRFRVTDSAGASRDAIPLQGIVRYLFDSKNETIGVRSSISIAADVSLGIVGGGRRRRQDAAREFAIDNRSSRARRDVCLQKTPNGSCSTCIGQRPTADANSDCEFDLRDATFLLDFVSRLSDNPLFSLGFPSSQLTSMDMDGNGVINMHDVEYAGNVEFGLYPLVQSVTVVPTSTGNACTFTIAIRLASKDDVGATAARTRVFVDVAGGSEFRETLGETQFLSGKFVQPTSNGQLWEAVANTSAPGLFQVNVRTNATDSALGVSVVIATLDELGHGSAVRTTRLLGGSPQSPFQRSEWTAVLEVSPNVRVSLDVDVYNSRVTATNTLSFDTCKANVGVCGISAPCVNGGACSNTETSRGFTCACPSAFTGETCAVANPCAPAPCRNGGTCQITGTNYKCTCAAGWSGSTCSARMSCGTCPEPLMWGGAMKLVCLLGTSDLIARHSRRLPVYRVDDPPSLLFLTETTPLPQHPPQTK